MLFLKTILYAGIALGSATIGQHLIHATRALMAGEQALAHINPYATAAQQDAQVSGALAQINQARGGAQQAAQQ
ncbi:hypothetical protein [Metallibacterium scheffleri]